MNENKKKLDWLKLVFEIGKVLIGFLAGTQI
jgi:hypothetical protein